MGDEMILELIQRDLDHDLSPAEKALLLKHLSRSTEDAKQAEQFHQLSELLSGLPQVNPPISVVDQILPQVEEDLKLRKQNKKKGSLFSRNRLKWTLGGSFVAAVIAIGVMVTYIEPLNEKTSNVALSTVQMKSVNQQVEKPNSSPTEESSSQPNNEMSQANDSSYSDTTKAQKDKTVIWSPNHKYQASWEHHQLIVRHASGEVQFTSETFPDSPSSPQIEWQSDRRIQLIFASSSSADSPTPITYDVEQKKRVK